MTNINTTIDKVAISEFGIHYDNLGDNEKKWCHDEMINNNKWLNPPYESEVDKWGF